MKAGTLILACGTNPEALLASQPKGPSAIYRIGQGDYARHLAARRRFISEAGESLTTEEEVHIAIAVDRWAWSLPGEERT